MEANERVNRHQAVVAVFLGIASLAALFISHLALTAIYHGESDLRLEWMALRVCFAVIFIFQVFALITFWRIIRSKNGAG